MSSGRIIDEIEEWLINCSRAQFRQETIRLDIEWF